MLLLVYWSLLLPAHGQRVGELVRQYPSHRSRVLRLLEPIGAPDEDPVAVASADDADVEAARAGLDMEMAINEHYYEVLDVFSDLFIYIFDELNKRCKNEIEAVRKQYPFEDLRYSRPTLRITYEEGHEAAAGRQARRGADGGPGHACGGGAGCDREGEVRH